MGEHAGPSRGALSRREALLTGTGLALGAAGAALLPRIVGGSSSGAGARGAPAAAATAPVDPTGEHQAGIARPDTPQQHALIAVLDFADRGKAGFLAALRDRLVALSSAIPSFAGQDSPSAVAPDGAGDLAITVGLGSAVVATIGPSLPGAAGLPTFVGDEKIAAGRTGGDVLIALYASNPAILSPALAAARRALGNPSVRWQQLGFRAPGVGTVARNPLGYHDGVIVPRGATPLDRNVWIPDGPAAGGTVCVIRHLRLDVARFAAQPPTRQDEVIGRHKADGSPLSGGGALDEVDLRAKTDTGQLVTPPRSHARAAHPSFTGSHLMLRRGYAYANGPATTPDGAVVDDQGLMFICFQRDLEDFVRTQRRLDEVDDLMGYVTPVSSGAFLILPGFDDRRPLGHGLL